MFSNYTQVMNFLDSLGLFHMDLTLTRVKDALTALNLNKLSFPVVQIVGTNGKGSTATFINHLAGAHDVRTGLFTSPHFVSPSERILCSGLPLPPEQWVNLSNKIHALAPNLTYFEFLTILALLAFVENNVELAIFEAGLGGKFDSTTAIARDVLCITPISMDHEGVLGDNIKSIAKDKALAMQRAMHVYYAEQPSDAMEIIENTAKEQGAILTPASNAILPKDTTLGLKGEHQKINALLALSAWQDVCARINCSYDEDKAKLGFASAFIAGRFQRIKTVESNLPANILLDGAHNEQGLEVLNNALSFQEQVPNVIMFSCMADKNMQAMLPKLLQLRAICKYCPLIIVGLQNNERALSSPQRASLAKMLGEHVYIHDDLVQALDFANEVSSNAHGEQELLICGSLYLLGEFFEIYPHYVYNKVL